MISNMHLSVNEEFLKEIKRYVSPYAFIEYARKKIAKQMDSLIKIEKPSYLRDTVRHEDYELEPIVIKKFPRWAEHATVPMVAFYSDGVGETIVEIITIGSKQSVKVVKCMNWVPMLSGSRGFVVIPPHTRFTIKPKPRSVIALRIKAKKGEVDEDSVSI